MRAWRPRRLGADGSLPAPFVYGVPDAWPHVRALYLDAGFVQEGHTELVLVANVDDLPGVEPLEVELRRTLGEWTRLSALRDGEQVGYIELETDFTAGGTLSRFAGWADIGNLVAPDEDTRRWLLAQAAEWLRLGGITRLVTYAWPEEEEKLAFARAHGFRELVRTERGFLRDP
jgi:hypothetical protein